MKCKPDPTKQYRSGENNFFVMSIFVECYGTERNGNVKLIEFRSLLGLNSHR